MPKFRGQGKSITFYRVFEELQQRPNDGAAVWGIHAQNALQGENILAHTLDFRSTLAAS